MSTLHAILAYAAQHVPRYSGLAPILSAFPMLNKREALADISAHVSNELGERKSELVEFISDGNRRSGSNQESFFDRQIMVEETSGSSGIPFRTAKTLEERSRMALGIWKYRKACDAHCTPKNFYTISHAPAGFQSRGSPRLYTRPNIDKFYLSLTEHHMRWVHCGPGTLCNQAAVISPAVAASKSVRFAESSGQALAEDARKFIEENLQVTLVDQYGCREAWAIAFRRSSKHFEVLTDNIVVELLDYGGQPILTGGQQGRIVVTSLHQRIFPIIRYDTGDLGMWAEGAIGRWLHLSNYREHNIYRYQEGEIDGNQLFKGVLLNAYMITGYLNFSYIQIRQRTANQFDLVTSQSPGGARLCAALNEFCKKMKEFANDVNFALVELSPSEVDREADNKTALFTTKYMMDENGAASTGRSF